MKISDDLYRFISHDRKKKRKKEIEEEKRRKTPVIRLDQADVVTRSRIKGVLHQFSCNFMAIS